MFLSSLTYHPLVLHWVGGVPGGIGVTLPRKSMVCLRAPWLFSLGILKLCSGLYLRGQEPHSTVRSGLRNLLQCVDSVCVWTVRQPHCNNTGARPHNYIRWQKASKLFCLLGIRKREKNSWFVNPRRKQKPSDCGCGYYLGVLRVTFVLQIELNKGKNQRLTQPQDVGIHCLLCSRCVFSSSATQTHIM